MNNYIDPRIFDEDISFVDFHVECQHPKREGETFEIPCRELDPGEALLFIIATQENYPERIGADYSEMTDAQKATFVENQKKISHLDNELYTEVALVAIEQPDWTRERIAKLPRAVRREIYEGAIAGYLRENAAVDAFPEESESGMSTDAESMLSSDDSES